MREEPSGQRCEGAAARPSPNQDEKRPTLEEVLREWERIGGSRRDGEPHRAPQLQTAAFFALMAGGFSFLFFPTGLLGLLVGWLTWHAAGRDLDRISMGFMDQDGFHRTEKARSGSYDGMALSICGLLLWSIILGYVYAILSLLSFL